MTISQAIIQLELVCQCPENGLTARDLEAIRLALSLLRDSEAHWQQQAEIAAKGGHGPGSDF